MIDVHDTPEDRVSSLASMPKVCEIVQSCIEAYAPVNGATQESVKMDRAIFDCFCLVALVGLDAVDAERNRKDVT